MVYKIEIETDNAAFEDEGGKREIARILLGLSMDIRGGCELDRTLRDLNGNRVGRAEMVTA